MHVYEDAASGKRDDRLGWLRRFFLLPNGIPIHDTLTRVFAALDRKAFAEYFGRWMRKARAESASTRQEGHAKRPKKMK